MADDMISWARSCLCPANGVARMANSSLLPEAVALLRRLAKLRRRIRLVAIVRGVSLLLAVLAAALVAAGFLDWRWHLPSLVRAIALVATLVGSGLIFLRFFLRPLRTPADDLSLALRIEDSYPSLNDALASTVQFLQPRSEGKGQVDSPAMRREAVKQALKGVASCKLERVVNSRGLGLATFSLAVAFTVAGVLVWIDPARAAHAMVRLGDPFGNHDWPRNTRIELDPPRPRIGRNEPFDIRGWLKGVIPPRATIVFRFDNLPPLEHEFDIQLEGSDAGRFATRLDAGRVHRNFRFQVFANDAMSEEFAVQVLPPPILVPLDGKPSPQLRVVPPAYTDLPSPQDLPPGTGNLEVVPGSRVVLRAAADRPLRRAWIEFQTESRHGSMAAFVTPFAAANLPGTMGLIVIGQTVWDPVPAQVEGDHRTFSIEFHPRISGFFTLYFEDETGLANSRLFELRLRPDPAPTVQFDRPSPSKDVLSVLATADLTLQIAAEDPLFALRSVWLEYRTSREGPPVKVLLHEPKMLIRNRLGPILGAGAAVANYRSRPARLDFRRAFSLRTVTHPNGSPLKERDIVLLQALADDFDDVTVNKEPGRSHEVEIRIVGRDTIDLVLSQKQGEVQQELLRLREKQREALAKVMEMEAKLKRGDKVPAEELNKLLEAEQIQHQIRERVGNQNEGLRGEVAKIQEILKQNNLRDSAARERMAEVSRELDRLAEKELDPIEPRLTTARKQAEMLEEGAQANRRGQLEEQAQENESRSRAADQAAKARAEEATKAEQRANKTADPMANSRAQAEARGLREQAEELRQRARELALQAARERREAKEPLRREKPVEELADARKHQEEVERTINDLLNRLEPWSSSREIKGEASKILQDEKELQQKVENLQNQGFPREEPARLTERQRGELDEMKAAQQRLEERTRQLLDKMKRLAEERNAKDPDTAQELQAAHEKGVQGDIAGQMKTAREQIQANRLGEAGRAQHQSMQELEKLVKMLEDRRDVELARLAKKLRQAEDRLAELSREQEELRKKVQDAGKIADPKERAEELKKLARRQENLRKEAKDLVQELSRLQANKAGKALGEADGQMARASRRMNEGDKPDDDDETLDRLNDAKREVQKAREEAEEALSREQMARVAEAILRLRDRQQELVVEASRIQAEVLRRAKAGGDKAAAITWPRELRLGSWKRLREAQQGLAQEADAMAIKELNGTPVYRRLLMKAGEAMTEAVKRMESVGNQPMPAETLPDTETEKLQKLSLRQLELLAEALKPEDEGKRMAAGEPAGGEGNSEGGSEGDGLPPLGQLKLLRAMQAEVNERTEAFRKAHPDLALLDKKAQAELQTIRRDQKEVADLLEALMKPAGEPAESREDRP